MEVSKCDPLILLLGQHRTSQGEHGEGSSNASRSHVKQREEEAVVPQFLSRTYPNDLTLSLGPASSNFHHFPIVGVLETKPFINAPKHNTMKQQAAVDIFKPELQMFLS